MLIETCLQLDLPIPLDEWSLFKKEEGKFDRSHIEAHKVSMVAGRSFLAICTKRYTDRTAFDADVKAARASYEKADKAARAKKGEVELSKQEVARYNADAEALGAKLREAMKRSEAAVKQLASKKEKSQSDRDQLYIVDEQRGEAGWAMSDVLRRI